MNMSNTDQTAMSVPRHHHHHHYNHNHHHAHDTTANGQYPNVTPNYRLNDMRSTLANDYAKSKVIPMYINQKVCKSPVVIQSVRSKHVQKPVAQTACIPPPLPPLPPPPPTLNFTKNISTIDFEPSTTNNLNNTIPSEISQHFIGVNDSLSYSFHDMTQVLSKLPPPSYHSNHNDSSSSYAPSILSHCSSQNSLIGNYYSPKVGHNNTTSDVFNSHNLSTRTTYDYGHGVYSSPNATSNSTSSNLFAEQRKYYPPPPYPGQIKSQPVASDDIPSDQVNKQPQAVPYKSTFIRSCTPQAFKFFMEQHIENLFKHRQARDYRRKQLESEMSKVDIPVELQDQMHKLLMQKETNYLRLRRAKMNKSMFETVKLLGIGAFGEVDLVRKIDTGRLYAMKTLHKTDVFNRNQAAHVKAERDILAEADSEWVVKLFYSFQDDQNLYFVMDYIPGGDLMNLLIKFQIFDENLARFYIAELVCAIESVHNLGFIHRDIKPDNILIDETGHIKLTDFGLCTGFHWTHSSKYYQIDDSYNRILERKMSNNRINNRTNCDLPDSDKSKYLQNKSMAHSLVGTPNYIAPEILSRIGYTKSCDWWSVGVILYEMLVGEPPFRDDTPAGTQEKVINWQTTLRIPDHCRISDESKDLIYKLCTHEETRLGKHDASEIKVHKFFETIDFNGDLRKKKALYIPKIKDQTDTSNFEPIPSHLLASRNNTNIVNQAANGEPNTFKSGMNTTNASSKNNDISQMSMTQTKANDNSQILYEFTFRRFFDEAYPEHFYVHNNGNDATTKQTTTNNNNGSMSLNDIFRNGDKLVLPAIATSTNMDDRTNISSAISTDHDRKSMDNDPEIYV